MTKTGSAWTGSFRITAVSDRNSTFDLLLPSTVDALPIEDYYTALKVSFECPFTLNDCVYPYCPQNVKSTSDPFFSHYYNK